LRYFRSCALAWLYEAPLGFADAGKRPGGTSAPSRLRGLPAFASPSAIAAPACPKLNKTRDPQ